MSLVMRMTRLSLRTLQHSISLSQRAAPVSYAKARLGRKYASVSAAFLQFGQPVHETHPHLLRPGERFNEPEAVAVIQKVGPSTEYMFHLFLRPKDALAEQWEGARSGLQAAIDVFNADKANEVYSETASSTSGFSTGKRNPTSYNFQEMFKNIKLKPLKSLINNLRITKSVAEIQNMRIAGKASGRAITNAMRYKWSKEKELGAFLDYEFKMNGCDKTAYVPVVAGGRNSLTIHYVRNDDVLQDGSTVLVDAGGEYGGYITDITRTWPINGKFTDAQKDLYEAVLSVQRSCISLCRESANMSLDMIHKVAEDGLIEYLRQLGFQMSSDVIRTLFPHHLGHYIGLDVHDCPGYTRSTNLKIGQCITVEPGIYVPSDDERWPKNFRGIGIRIEDSVCVQEDSPLVLTTEAVKEVVDIESLRN